MKVLKKNLTKWGLPILEDLYVPLLYLESHLTVAYLKDPEDRKFTPPIDYSQYSPDPSVGAVLCGADNWISTS